VSEAELRRVLDAETVDYLVKHMPTNKDGNFDYNAFTESNYRSH